MVIDSKTSLIDLCIFPVMTQFYDRPSLSKYYDDPADALETQKEARIWQLWDELVEFFEGIPLMKSKLKVSDLGFRFSPLVNSGWKPIPYVPTFHSVAFCFHSFSSSSVE